MYMHLCSHVVNIQEIYTNKISRLPVRLTQRNLATVQILSWFGQDTHAHQTTHVTNIITNILQKLSFIVLDINALKLPVTKWSLQSLVYSDGSQPSPRLITFTHFCLLTGSAGMRKNPLSECLSFLLVQPTAQQVLGIGKQFGDLQRSVLWRT